MKYYLVASVFLFALGANIAHAVTAPKNFGEFVTIIIGIMQLLLPVLFSLALLGFIWGLAKFINASSKGDETGMESGKTLMLWGVIALAVMFSVWALVGVLTASFGLDAPGLPLLPTG